MGIGISMDGVGGKGQWGRMRDAIIVRDSKRTLAG